MEIKVEPHTLERAKERGASLEEIKEVLENGFDIPARGNRKAKAKVFDFNKERIGKYYKEKRIEVIYIEEQNIVVTITVYVFYGEWKV